MEAKEKALMPPLRLVIDANVLVSAAPNPEGLERTTLLLAVTEPARLYLTRPILHEYAGVCSTVRTFVFAGALVSINTLLAE
jgi:predicted nucleic acid-binding protein